MVYTLPAKRMESLHQVLQYPFMTTKATFWCIVKFNIIVPYFPEFSQVVYELLHVWSMPVERENYNHMTYAWPFPYQIQRVCKSRYSNKISLNFTLKTWITIEWATWSKNVFSIALRPASCLTNLLPKWQFIRLALSFSLNVLELVGQLVGTDWHRMLINYGSYQ